VVNRPISAARHCRSGGFTLTEVVIALAILAVAVGAVSLTHLQTLKAARAVAAVEARLAPLERLTASRAAGLESAVVAADLRATGWMAEAEFKGGGGEPLWESWRLSPSGQPWSAVSVCLTVQESGARSQESE
jgi:prepilin-type N-terminal cleavage/methylation domain-containing protein